MTNVAPKLGGSTQGRDGTSLKHLGGTAPSLHTPRVFYVLLRKHSNVWRSQTGRQRGTRALLKHFGYKKKNVLSRFFSALSAEGAAANCVIALLITYDSLPVRTGPDVLFFDNTGSFRAITLVQFPA